MVDFVTCLYLFFFGFFFFPNQKKNGDVIFLFLYCDFFPLSLTLWAARTSNTAHSRGQEVKRDLGSRLLVAGLLFIFVSRAKRRRNWGEKVVGKKRAGRKLPVDGKRKRRTERERRKKRKRISSFVR